MSVHPDTVEHVVEHAELMIEESIEALAAIDEGRECKNASPYGRSYDRAYHQGRKDACRVIMLCVNPEYSGKTSET